jgi:hypothetical protein
MRLGSRFQRRNPLAQTVLLGEEVRKHIIRNDPFKDIE